MRIINCKYRIDRLVSNSRSYSMYEAVDLTKNKKKVNLYILNTIHIEKSLLDHYISEYEKIDTSRDSSINILDFDSTINLSSKEKKLEYFYVTESISEYKPLIEIAEEVEENTLIDIFMKICNLAQEECFSYIKTIPFSVESIYVSKRFEVKLKDKITALLDCRELGVAINYENNDNFKYTSSNKSLNENYYLEKLREILLNIVLQNKKVKLYGKIQHDVDEAIISEKNHEYIEVIGKNISELIYNLYNNLNLEESKILNIISEVNRIFNTSYIYKTNKREILSHNTPLIGRNHEVTNIITSMSRCMREKIEQNVILIHGEIGIGKTRLITHIKHLIDINYRKNFKCFYVEDCENGIAISNLLKQIVITADKDLLNKYKKELSIIIPTVYEENSIDYYEENELNIKDNIALMTKIALFLLEYYSDKSDVIIFDNVHMYDNFSMGIIRYILSQERCFRNIPVIISYRDGDCLSNCDFTDMISGIKSRVDLEIHLTPLSEEMTSMVLRNILNIDVISDKFREIVYKNSMGNPFFIEEGIKYLRDRKVIYINEKDGTWNKVLNHEIYMSTDMEEICRQQLEILSEKYKKMLYKMSYFYMPISLSIIIEFLNVDEEEILKSLNYLISKGILYKTQYNQSFRYEFYNKFLKNYLYRSIDKKEISIKHHEIVKILMKQYKNNDDEFLEEIIYHLEKIKDKRILNFYQKREKDLEKFNKIEEAINFNFKILNFIDENRANENLREEEILANVNLGRLHNKLSEKRTSIDFYLKAKSLCNEEKYLNQYIDILREILFLSIDLGLNRNVQKYLNEMRAAVEKTNYRVGKIKYLTMIIWEKYNNQEYDTVKELCNYAIELCNEDHEEDKLSFMNYYVDTLVVEGRELEALELLKPMAEKCEQLKFNKRLCRISNSMGVLYSDYLQCSEESLKWFKKSYELGEVSDDDSYKVNSLGNLGFINYVMLNYKEAYDYFNLASNKAMEYEVLSLNFYNFSYIGILLYKMGRYGESYKYSKLCSHYMDKDYLKYWQEAGPYCIFMYFISDISGNRDECKRYLEEGMDILKNSKSITGYEIGLLHSINSLCYDENNLEVLDVINSAEKILYIDFRISILCYGINKLINLGLIKKAERLYRYILSKNQDIQSDLNKLEICYLGVVLTKDINYKTLIESSINQKYDNIMLNWKLNFEVAKGYYEDKKYTYAAVHISECCGTIIEILESIPNQYLNDFINENKAIIKAFELMIKIRKHYGVIKPSYPTEIDIYEVKNIISYFKHIIKHNIVNNMFLKELRRENKSYFQKLKTLEDVIGKLSNNITENLNNICDYVNILTIASNTSIILENEGRLSVVCSTNGVKNIPEELAIINIARSKKSSVILKDKKIIGVNGNIISHEIDDNNKTIMCIPINQVVKAGKDKENDYTNELLGYIYVESNKKINNINIKAMKKCINISRLLYIIIDREGIKKNASIDNLTNTLMRKHLEVFIHEEIEKSYIYGREFSIIMLDIDKFKEINDNYGHRMGDRVLSKMCQNILANIRKSDVVGRYGGEEFIIVLPDTGVSEAERIAERIRTRIEKSRLLGDKRDVTVSMGIANYPNHATIYDELIEKSDQALYEAKNSGRNRTNIWNESYGYKISTTNRLSGIFVGNENQDYKNVSTVIEFIDLINSNIVIGEKIAITMNRILEITEAETCILYTINNENILSNYCKNINENHLIDGEYSVSTIKSAIKNDENICGIDWECIKETNKNTVIPDIKSNMVILLRNKQKIIGAIHLCASINHREFNYDQLNYINTLGKIMVPMVEGI